MNSKNKSLNIFVIGTRAQLIKVAPIIYECEKINKKCLLLMTGQHKDTMADIVSEFSLSSEQIFAVNSQERSTIISLMLWLPQAIINISKNLRLLKKTYFNFKINVLVHGDTLTTFISAYCAKLYSLNTIHIESGLTSNKLFSPFPEEFIRRLVFKVANIALCPDAISTAHMQKISKAEVINTLGNSIFDAVDLSIANRQKLSDEDGSYIVFSIHRFQNLYNPKRLEYIVKLIKKLSAHIDIYFILHPTTKKRLEKEGYIKQLMEISAINLMDRMTYCAFIRLVNRSECVFTDGGSNQEELAYLGIPTIIMRDATERIDGLNQNARMEDQIESLEEFIKAKQYKALKMPFNPQKNNHPSQKVAQLL